MKNTNIAIVGMDCRYPGAHNISEYWENILALRQQFRRIPDQRLNLLYYGSDDASSVDTTYCKKAAVLQDYNFDRVKYRISKGTFDQTDMAHWLALDVVAGALQDAGFKNGDGLNKEKVGVIIGNSLNGEFTRANLMRLRWPYVFKAFEATLYSLDYNKTDISEILGRAEKIYKDPFPVPDADTLAGGLSNTLAGRVCNYFNFNGGGYTVDGACSSSLLALVNGCNAVANGDMDVALVGGVDLSIDPFEMIGFSRNGALAPDKMEVFSGRSQGFWPGEGCGIVVLMREEEARAKGLNIYSVIKGWGISSDGKGGITRPKAETQQLAIQRAYERAGYPISAINLFEAHGTGTPVGDKIELTALVNELKLVDKNANTPVVGSVKHLIGHAKAAAGIAGLIKASLAIRNRIIPGGIGINEVNPVLAENADVLHLSQTVQLYKEDEPMRASVSSFGFGGINVHITMEENDRANFKPKRLSTKIKALASSHRDAEVFPLAANSKEALLDTLEQLTSKVRDISIAEFIDLSVTLTSGLKKTGKWKAGIVANTPDQLLEQCLVLKQTIIDGATEYNDVKNGLFFNATGKAGKIAFLFPGQGAPVYENWGIFNRLNRELFDENIVAKIKGNSDKNVIKDTSVAQPAIVKNNLQAIALLNNLGVDADWGIGHSLGEITGFAWANSMDSDTAIELAEQRGDLMSKHGEQGGTLLAIKAPLSTIQPIVDSLKLTITGYNGTDSFVVGGPIEDIEKLEQNAFQLGLQHTRLKVSHAFHTPMMQQAATAFKTVLEANTFSNPKKQLISTVTGTFLEAETDIQEHLYKQIEQPVKFIQAVKTIQNETNFFIETGPGRTLSKTLKQETDNVIAIDFGSNSIEGLLKVLAACFTIGQDVLFEELNFSRFHKNFDLANWELNVLESPCEQLNHDTTLANILNKPIAQNTDSNNEETPVQEKLSTSDNSEQGVLSFLKELISIRTEIPLETIRDDERIMSQFHLNSLTIAEIVSTLTKKFNKSHKVFSKASILANADGSLKDLAELVYQGEVGNAKRKSKDVIDFEGLTNWTHIFQRQAVAKAISNIQVDRGQGEIKVYGCERETLRLKEELKETRLKIGEGSVFVYNTKDTQDILYNFLGFLQQKDTQQKDFICLVNVVSETVTGDLKPVLRSFQQEYPDIQAFSLDVDADLVDKEIHIIEELKTYTKYKEISYTAEGERQESEFTTFFPQAGELSDVLNQEDVILATGGGKGITYESILALGMSTKVKLAILGRSTPESNSELQENLARLDEEGITYKYYAADVCDKVAIQAATEAIRTDLGAISVIIHGAGINNPKLIDALQKEDFERTERVKVQGLRNVLDSIEKHAADLKLLIGYGSIIAQSGMQGNADYAWSNDQLAHLLDNYSQKNSDCRSLTLEWSVWQGTGMGENLNSIDNLKNQGVWPIPIDQGLEVLKATIADPNCAGRLVVSGRFGKIPTLIYNKQRLPIGRFIMNLKHHVPTVEAICDVGINLKDDVYLNHHVFDGQYVFPTVMILEGMAQVCSILYPEGENWSFKDLQISRSIFIPKNKANTVRFIVSRISEQQFKAVVRSEDSNFEITCFEATIDFSESLENSKISPIESANLQELNLNIDDDFYDNLLFHSGPFRRIKSFYHIHALESLARATSNTSDQWFDSFISEQKLLGDPGLNDAAIHCHQACRPGQQLLPTGATEVYFNPKVVQGPFFIKTEELKEEGNNTWINVYVVNGEGDIKSIWKNLVLTQVTGKACNRNWIPELLVPYIEYQIIHNSGDRTVRLSPENCRDMLDDLSDQSTSKACQVDKFSISLQKQDSESILDVNNKSLSIKGLEDQVFLAIQHD